MMRLGLLLFALAAPQGEPAAEPAQEEIPLDEPYASPFDDEEPAKEAQDEEIPLEEPYSSPFDDEDQGRGDDDEEIPLDAPYESPFDAKPKEPAPEPGTIGEDGEPVLELESIAFENREYFRETTIRRFIEHPAPAPLDEEVLAADAENLTAKYKSRGYVDAEVSYTLRPGKNPYGRVGVFVIDAGERAPLERVDIVGNVLVRDQDLKQGLFSRGPEPLGWVTRAAFYHKPFVDQDVQRLLANYYSRGFLEAQVAERRLEARPGLDGLVLVFQVVEGPVYELIDLELTGDLPEGVTGEELRRRISVKDGAVADLITIQKEADVILNDLREVGYPFARVEQAVELGPPPSGDPDRRGIALTLSLTKGEPAKVGEIKVEGNEGLLYGTLDRVILRDVLLEPGDDYRHSLVEQSKKRLMALGYFSQVEIRPVPTDEPNTVDLVVKVAEQPTWLLNLAPAFVANEGFILIGIAADRHVLGSGLSVSLIGTLSLQRQVFDFSVTEPRLFDTRISTTGELHRRLISYRHFRIGSEFGGGARVSFPIAPIGWGLFLGGSATAEYGGVVNYIDDGTYHGPLAPENDLFPQKVTRNVIEATATFDKRDSLLTPRNGVLATASVSYGGRFTGSGVGVPTEPLEDALGVELPYFRSDPASTLDFVKAEGNLRLFFTPLWNITFKSNTKLGFAFNPHGGEVPVTDRFFLGGFGSIRGYFPRSIAPTRVGPKTAGQAIQVGGVKMFSQNTEIEFPVWPETPFRAFVFTDAGNTFDDDEPFLPVNLNDPLGGALGAGLQRGTPVLPAGLFWSVGFGLLIQTPVFPLRFEWSVPLTRRDTELRRPIDFFFGVGSAF